MSRSHAARRSSRRSSGSTPCARRLPTQATIATDVRSRPHAPTSLPERERVLARSRSSFSLRLRRAPRARRRSHSCPSSRERSVRSRSWKRRWTMRSGTRRSQVSLHRQLAVLGRLTKGMEWAQRHARAAMDLADSLGDDALRAGALSALAFLRFNGGDPDAPRDAERAYELALACGDQQQLHRAEYHARPRARVVGAHRAGARLAGVPLPAESRARRAGRRVRALASGARRVASGPVDPSRAARRERLRDRRAVRNPDPVPRVPARACRRPSRRPRARPGARRARPRARGPGRRAPRRAGGDRGRRRALERRPRLRLRPGSPRARRQPMRPAGASRTCAGGAPTTQRR